MIETKYGRAVKNSDGYYQINSRKEGNHSKLLHRLIYEDFYGEIPKGMHIHHKDGNRLNNDISNLELISPSNHHIFHNKNRVFEDKSKIKISKSRNTSGYFRVKKEKNNRLKQGFRWVYKYYENGVQKALTSVDLQKLEEKVKSKGLLWLKLEDYNDC